MQPVRSRRGEDVFAEDGGEAGGRDGAAQIIDEVVESTNPARDMAARILQGSPEEQSADPARTAQRNDDRDEQSTPSTRAADKGPAGTSREGEQAAAARPEGEQRAARGAVSPGPQVEDQTLIELRQGFAAGRDNDDLDMGI